MKKLRARSRADLLLCLERPQGLGDDAVALLGYERIMGVAPHRLVADQAPSKVPATSSLIPEPSVPEEIVIPVERPRLKFLMPVKVETLVVDQPRRERGDPISDVELAVDWSRSGPPLPALTRWARLAPFLRNRLGAVIPGARLDVRKLMRQAGSGLPLAVLPRLPRPAWAAQAVVLWDATPEMFPFTRDADWLLRRLRRERGAHGLEVRVLKRLPGRKDAARIPRGVPVLALSAMGQFQGAESTMAAWLALARWLTFLGQSFHALTPCPRDRWQPQVATHWPSAVWDRRPRLPRRGGLHPVPAVHDKSAATERLLTLLAPASRIEPPLMRTARLQLSHAADAGTEWDVWHHEEGWHSLGCCGFRPGAAYEKRLAQRGALTGAEAGLAREIGALMSAHHASCSSVIAAEAELRACLGGTPDAETMQAVKKLLQRVVDRLRLLAAEPGGAEGLRSGLPAWFTGMVDRLHEFMRGEETVRELIAQGLALSHTCLETAHAQLQAGVDGEVFKAAKGEAARRLPEPVVCRIELVAGGWRLMPATFAFPPPQRDAVTLAYLSVSRRPVHLAFAGGTRHSYQLATPVVPITLPSLTTPVPFTIESDRERIHFDAMERPAWASRVYYDQNGLTAEARIGDAIYHLAWTLRGKDIWPALDEDSWEGAAVDTGRWLAITQPKWASRLWADKCGLAAEFGISGVPFVLRWIPPGRFLMGSPSDEPGRIENEGPQHEVILTQGYWLGETPVTQAQWRAVIEAAVKDSSFLGRRLSKGKGEILSPEPSQFKGPDSLPVESVNWHDSQQYVQLLNKLLQEQLPPGFNFRLPTEAQWEYACRAFTDTALYSGDITILAENNSPELDVIAWYGGNSGNNLEVKNPYNSSDWPSKQYSNSEAGPHCVRQKCPNPWGLYDMLGNVLEWCQDAWSDYDGKQMTNPLQLGDQRVNRVVRGGSWDARARFCRSAFRNGGHPDRIWHAQGLRLSAGQEIEMVTPFMGLSSPRKPQVVDITALIRDTVEFAGAGSNVQVRVSSDDNLRHVNASPVKLSQVLQNLVINGIQAMPRGGYMDVQAVNHLVGAQGDGILKPGPHVRIVVRDRGCGIAKENLDRLFRESFTTKPDGNGIGLTTCKRFIDEMGGDIRVSSEPNVGAEFSVYLPASERLITKPLTPVDTPPVPLKYGKGKVFVVDDEDDVRKVVHLILTRCGYEVVQCDNGQDAVRIYQSLFRTGTPPDVVLMDLTLRGDMNGTETAAKILLLDPEARIVCTCGSVTPEVQSVFLERGFIGVLPKPYEAGELTQIVHRVTSLKRHV
jgi:formylglycine-generating enzyme required for sulfatase activity/CheY-like chemotaxis protein